MTEHLYSITELHEIIGVETQVIVEYVEYGVLEPENKNEKYPDHFQFSSSQLERLRRGIRLQHDLALNTAGVALALELIEELNSTRSQLKELEHLLALLKID